MGEKGGQGVEIPAYVEELKVEAFKAVGRWLEEAQKYQSLFEIMKELKGMMKLG